MHIYKVRQRTNEANTLVEYRPNHVNEVVARARGDVCSCLFTCSLTLHFVLRRERLRGEHENKRTCILVFGRALIVITLMITWFFLRFWLARSLARPSLTNRSEQANLWHIFACVCRTEMSERAHTRLKLRHFVPVGRAS